MTHTLTPDERHAVAGELRWLARRREQDAVMSPAWLRQRADWIEESGERRAPAREREDAPSGGPPDWLTFENERSERPGWLRRRRRTEAEDGHLDALMHEESVLRWGEPQ